jgi:hypothetical protein
VSDVWHAVSGFFHGVWSDITGAVGSVEKGVKYIYDVFVGVFHLVHGAWDDMVRGAEAVGQWAGGAFRDVYNFGKWVIDKAIPDVVRWVTGKLAWLGDQIAQGLVTLSHWVSGLVADIWDGIKAIPGWVVHNIYEPLKGFFDQAWHWITHEGALLWYYITHPETLAKLLVEPMWWAFLWLIRESTAAIGHFLVAGIYAAMITTANVIEDIFAGMV